MSVETIAAPQVDGSAKKLVETLSRVHELIQSRWSPRAFSTRAVDDGDLRTIIEAARWASSSYNEQPWRFLVARKSEGPAFDKFLNLLVPANQAWAKDASVLLLTVAKRIFSHSGSSNYYALHDAGQALAHIALQATALGLHSHSMGGFDHERARKELGIPEDYEIGAAVALGYLGSQDALPNSSSKRERKPMEEIAFGASWNEALKF